MDCFEAVTVSGGDVSQTEIVGPRTTIGKDKVREQNLLGHLALVVVAASLLEQQRQRAMFRFV